MTFDAIDHAVEETVRAVKLDAFDFDAVFVEHSVTAACVFWR